MRKKFYGMALAVVMAGAVSMMSGTVALANYNQKEAEESEASKDEVPQVVSEEKPDGTPFSIAGNGEVLDDISDDETKQFITVRTKNNQTFFVVIDRANSIDNVYMLSMIDENDLEEFLEDSEEEDEPQVVLPENSGVELDENGNPIQSDAVTEDSKSDGNSGGLLWMAIGVVVLGGGGYYFFKIRKPKQQGGVNTGNGLQSGINSEADSEYNDDGEYEDDDAEYDDDEYDDEDIDEEDVETENDDEEMDFEFEDEDSGDEKKERVEEQAKETGKGQKEHSEPKVEDNTEDYYDEDDEPVEPEKPVRRRRRRRNKKTQIEQS